DFVWPFEIPLHGGEALDEVANRPVGGGPHVKPREAELSLDDRHPGFHAAQLVAKSVMILSVTRTSRSMGSCGGVTRAIRRMGCPAAWRICSPRDLKAGSTRSPVRALVRMAGHAYF